MNEQVWRTRLELRAIVRDDGQRFVVLQDYWLDPESGEPEQPGPTRLEIPIDVVEYLIAELRGLVDLHREDQWPTDFTTMQPETRQ